MDIIQRREALKNLIIERQEISVNEINELFDVSSVTLRNDLIHLERMGICKRLFGKVTANINHTFLNLNYGNISNMDEKERIGKYAASLIQPGDSVLFYAGSTTQQIARFIDPDLEFVAATNSLYIALELNKLKNVQLVLLGGAMNPKLCATYGMQTIQQIRNLHVDKLFFSSDGVDPKNGITNIMPFESEINQAILECAKEVYAVADHTKIGKVSFVQMGRADQIDVLITDSAADPEILKEFREIGIDVKTV